MLEVDDEVALDQFGKIQQLVDLGPLHQGARLRPRPPRALAAEDLRLGDHDQAPAPAGSQPRRPAASGAPGRVRGKVSRKPSFKLPRSHRG